MDPVLGSILMVILFVAGIVYPESISHIGTKQVNRLTAKAKEIYNKISDNRELMDKLTDAYQRKDADYAAQLLQSSGFGPRTEAIRNAAKEAKAAYQADKTKLQKRDAELTNQYNEINAASYNTNTIAGIKNADNIINGMEQAINGGSNEQKKI